MSTRPQCILVSPVFPSPRGSGLEQRAFYLLGDLAAEYDTHLIIASDDLPVGPASETILQMACTVSLVALPTERPLDRASLLDSMRGVTLHQHLPADLSLAVFFRLSMHPLRQTILRGCPVTRIMLDLDDLESSTLRSIGWFALRRGRLRLALKSCRTWWHQALLERRSLRLYDLVMFANKMDERALSTLCEPARLACRANRIAIPARCPRPSSSAPFTLLFVGTLGYFPNNDAALWLAEELVSALRRRLTPGFRVRIVGRGAEQRLVDRLAKIPEVQFLGEVERVDELYEQAHVALGAVRCGGGTKVKVLEAIAFRCPLVATPHSLLGLPLRPGRDVLAASTSEQMAECCAELQRHPDQAQTMANHAFDRLRDYLAEAETESKASIRMPSLRR